MIEHVIGGDRRHPHSFGKHRQSMDAFCVVAPIEMVEGEIDGTAKIVCETGQDFGEAGIGLVGRQCDQDLPRAVLDHIDIGEPALAFLRTPLAAAGTDRGSGVDAGRSTEPLPLASPAASRATR